MTEAIAVTAIVCGTILVLAFGIAGIGFWIDRYTFGEMQRIAKLEKRISQLELNGKAVK